MTGRWMLVVLLGSVLPACCDCDDDDDDFYWSFNSDNGSGRGSHLQPEVSTPVIELRERLGVTRRSLPVTLTLEPLGELGPVEELGAFASGREIPSQMRRLPCDPSGRPLLELDLRIDLPAHASRSIAIRAGRRLPIDRPWSTAARTLAHPGAGLELGPHSPLHPERAWMANRPVLRQDTPLLESAHLTRAEVTASGYLRRVMQVGTPEQGAQELHLDWGGTIVWRRSRLDEPIERLPVGVGLEIRGARHIAGGPLEIAWDLERLTRRP